MSDEALAERSLPPDALAARVLSPSHRSAGRPWSGPLLMSPYDALVREVTFTDKQEMDVSHFDMGKSNLTPQTVCLGDVDNDGMNELVLATGEGKIAVYKENTFLGSVRVEGSAAAICVGDVLNVGKNHLVVVTNEGMAYVIGCRYATSFHSTFKIQCLYTFECCINAKFISVHPHHNPLGRATNVLYISRTDRRLEVLHLLVPGVSYNPTGTLHSTTSDTDTCPHSPIVMPETPRVTTVSGSYTIDEIFRHVNKTLGQQRAARTSPGKVAADTLNEATVGGLKKHGLAVGEVGTEHIDGDREGDQRERFALLGHPLHSESSADQSYCSTSDSEEAEDNRVDSHTQCPEAMMGARQFSEHSSDEADDAFFGRLGVVDDDEGSVDDANFASALHVESADPTSPFAEGRKGRLAHQDQHISRYLTGDIDNDDELEVLQALAVPWKGIPAPSTATTTAEHKGSPTKPSPPSLTQSSAISSRHNSTLSADMRHQLDASSSFFNASTAMHPPSPAENPPQPSNLHAVIAQEYVNSAQDPMFNGYDDLSRLSLGPRKAAGTLTSYQGSRRHSRSNSGTFSTLRTSQQPSMGNTPPSHGSPTRASEANSFYEKRFFLPPGYPASGRLSSRQSPTSVTPQHRVLRQTLHTPQMKISGKGKARSVLPQKTIHDRTDMFLSVRRVTSKIEYKPLSVAHWRSLQFKRQLGNVSHVMADDGSIKIYVVLSGGILVRLPSLFATSDRPYRNLTHVDVFSGLRERMMRAGGGDDQSLSFTIEVLIDKTKPTHPGVKVAVSKEEIQRMRQQHGTQQHVHQPQHEAAEEAQGSPTRHGPFDEVKRSSFSRAFLVCTTLGNIALYDVAREATIWTYRTRRHLLCGHPIKHTLWRGFTRKRPVAVICSWDGTTIFINQQGIPTFFRLDSEVSAFLCARIGASDKLSLLYFSLNNKVLLVPDAHYCTDTVDMDSVLEEFDRRLTARGHAHPRSKYDLARQLHTLLYEF